MKKTIVALFALVAIMGCGGSPKTNDAGSMQNPARIVHEGFIGVLGHQVSVIDVDGCEYLLARASEAISIIHKADCKNVGHVKP